MGFELKNGSLYVISLQVLILVLRLEFWDSNKNRWSFDLIF